MIRIARTISVVAAACVALGGSLVVVAAPAGAVISTPLTVDSSADGVANGAHCTTPVPGACTLRDAFAAANGNGVDTTININVGSGPINLSLGELFYSGTNALTVHGNGVTVNQTTVNARVFDSTTGQLLTLDGMTITGSNVSSLTVHGGAIDAANGDLTITNSTVKNNTASGSAIGASLLETNAGNGKLTITNTTFDSNTATGTAGGDCGGVVFAGATTIMNSTFSNNTCAATGTGNSFGILNTLVTTISGGAVTGNRATSTGAASFGILFTSDLTVSNVTLTNNVASAGGPFTIPNPCTGCSNGLFDSNTTTVTGSTITGNTNSTTGGDNAIGIFNTGATTVTSSTISGNTVSAAGGGRAEGILNPGVLTVTGSSVTGNTSTATGTGNADGIVDTDAPVTITSSTLSGNTVSSAGGAGDGGVASPQVTVTNSTISDNTTTGITSQGGGISVPGLSDTAVGVQATDGRHPPKDRGVRAAAPAAPTTTLVYATITGNSAQTGANIFSSSPVTAFGSVVALPKGGPNCSLSAGLTSNGWNFSDDSTCGFTNTGSGDRQNAGDPKLAALANNGGPGPTRLPQTGSPLIDAIPTASCQADGASGITTDERGVTRPQGPGCDIGAVEVVPTPATLATPATPVVITPRFTG